MGTRGFWGFVNSGVEKITYNHMDSYPEGLGTDVLAWARAADWDKVREQVTTLRMVSDTEAPTEGERITLTEFTDSRVSTGDDWYSILRHCQGDPAKTLASGHMTDGHGFPFDSLFAEWGYLFNLDDGTFEVYQGFQQSPPTTGRWSTPEKVAEEQAEYDKMIADNPRMAGGGRYYAVGLRAVWALHDLPQDDEFLLTFHERDD